MEEYITISTLNDFIFCPYSIYLHNVYMEADEDLYHAVPQTQGKNAHAAIDNKRYSTCKDDILSLPIYSEELGIMGKIDIYKTDKELLIERKYELRTIYQGQIYQLWAQYFCMIEMGYKISKIAFYEISTNTMKPINIPSETEKQELIDFIICFRSFNPMTSKFNVNTNKCTHCIYCNLCDKTIFENVY
ncbi:MAG: type V CRISPR-associated protein Cas4 [Muribaculaceae bacterium]